jgi:pyruvate dehydrogenase E2 component (dihydrolipoamide acetyltransferase)
MQRIPLTGTRGEIAKRMVASSQSAAMVAISMYVNFSAAQQLREVTPGVSPLDLLIRATALELRANPRLNSAIHNDAIEVYQQVNIGFAVSLPDSLIVPVIRNADSKSLIEISNERKVLADSARNGSLSVNAVKGGTFTITSLGKYGVTVFTPILNPPQTGILGIGAVERVPVVDGDGGVKVQPRLTLTLVFDHRASDGAPAAELLKAIRERVERGEVN